MPEERGLYPRMRVGEQLEYFGRLHGLDAAPRHRRPRRAGSSGSASPTAPDAKVEELSHGNQQRAQLAAALLHEPELLVLDEPFAGLDPVAVRTLAEVLRGEAARGAAVLFSSHQLELVEDICEDVAIIDHGRVVATGRPRRAAARPRSGGGSTLRLEGAPPEWLPDVAGVELVERRNGDLRLARAPRRRPGAGARRGGADGAGRRVQLRPALARGALPGAGASDERAAGDRARRPARDPRAPAQPRLPRLDRSSCSSPSAASTAFSAALLRRDDLPRRGDCAGAARARRRAPTRGGAVRREGAASHVSPRRQPDARRSQRSTSTRCCSCRDDRLVFRANVDPKLAAVADTAVRALRRHLPPAPELTTATLEPADPRDHRRRGRWSRMLGAVLLLFVALRSTASGCSAASSRRRTTASSR